MNSIDRLGVDTTNYVVKNWRTIATSATAAGGVGPTLGTQGIQKIQERRWLVVCSVLIVGGLCAVVCGCRCAAGG